MKKITIFLAFFLIFVFYRLADSAEKKYLNIGGDPVMKDMCARKKLKTFSLPEDTFVVTTGKSRKVYVGWLREGEEIGWLNKEQTEYAICRCGNAVKFLQAPEEKIETKPKPKIEPKPEFEPKPEPIKEAKETEEEVEFILVEDYPEVVYIPVERPRPRLFIDSGWGWGYGGGYAIGGRVIRGHGYHDHGHRDYRKPEPRPRHESGPPRSVHPPTPPIPH